MSTQPGQVLSFADCPDRLLALEALLAGVRPVVVRSGADAARLVAGQEFAVVVLDFSGPASDALETARRLRAGEQPRQTPILFVVREGAPFPVAEAYQLGAVDVLTDPFLPAAFQAKVATFVDLSQKTRRLREVERANGHNAAAHLRRVVESVTDFAIFSTDAAGIVTTWNAGAERLFGWAESDILGQPAEVLFTPEDCAQGTPAHELHEAAATGRASDERWHLRKDGSRFFASGVVTPIVLNGLKGFTKVARDITARKAAEGLLRDEKEFAEALVNGLPGVFYLIDAGGVFRRWNRNLEQVTGYASEEIARMLPTDFFHPADRPTIAERVRAVFVNGSATAEVPLQCKDGQRIPHFFTGVRVLLGGEPYLTGLGIDITDRVRAEAGLKEADRRKDVFLATLAHELRNPLAPLRNAISVLRSVDENPNPTARQMREMMGRQVTHMARLIDDLLDVSRINRGKIQLKKERVVLGDVVQAAVETVTPFVEQRRHRLSVELPTLPVVLNADPTRVAQVVANLLNNAAKYTPPGGHVWLSAAVEGDAVVLRVRDTGVGIPPDALVTVFDLFTQVDRTLDRADGGLGIGLALVKSLAELHGGRVDARSDGPGQGSEFTLRLPLAEPSATEGVMGVPVEDSAVPRGRRVLVVEDNRDGAESLRMILEAAGHEVQVAHDGREGVATARRFRPEVVVCDIGMPVLSGYELAQTLRADPTMASIRLVAVSGYGQAEDVRRAREAGFETHLVKPVDPEQLLRVLAAS